MGEDIMVKWSNYCLSASHYVRWVLGLGYETSTTEHTENTELGSSVSSVSSVVEQIEQRMAAGETFVLEDFPLETVAALCDQHNYRWTFCDRPNGKASLRFVLRPGQKVIPNSPSRAA